MPFDCSNPAGPLADYGWTPSSCSSLPILINAMGGIADYLCSLNLGELEFRVAVTNNPADFDALFLGVGSDNRLVVDSDSSLWYSALAVGGWTLVAAGYCITNDTLANILAEQAGGTLSPGCWYQVNDNVHAEGGDLLMIALDATHLSPTGYYYHAPGDIWFPMEWNPENGDIVYLKDTRWNNVAYGVLPVDEFIWTVNDTLADTPGDWANNTFISTLSLDFSAITPGEYGVFQENRFEYCTLELGGVLTNISNNLVSQNSFFQITANTGATAFENNTLVGGRIIATTCDAVTISGNTLTKAVISAVSVTGASSIINNSISGDTSNAILGASTLTDVVIRNNEIDNSFLTIGTSDTLTIRSNVVKSNSILEVTGTTTTSVNYNYLNDGELDIDNGDNSTFLSNTINNSDINITNFTGDYSNNEATLSNITMLDTLIDADNNSFLAATISFDNVDILSFNGNQFANTTSAFTDITPTSIAISLNRIADNSAVNFTTFTSGEIQFVSNEFSAFSSVTITNVSDNLDILYNKTSANSGWNISAVLGPTEIAGNSFQSLSSLTITTTDGIEIDHNLLSRGTIAVIDSAVGGQVNRNVINGLSSININSASYDGSANDNELGGQSIMRLTAHSGDASINRLFASDITATKNALFSCTTNLWFNSTVVLAAGVDTIGTNTGD